jgi:hypothetical protein
LSLEQPGAGSRVCKEGGEGGEGGRGGRGGRQEGKGEKGGIQQEDTVEDENGEWADEDNEEFQVFYNNKKLYFLYMKYNKYSLQ